MSARDMETPSPPCTSCRFLDAEKSECNAHAQPLPIERDKYGVGLCATFEEKES